MRLGQNPDPARGAERKHAGNGQAPAEAVARDHQAPNPPDRFL